MGLFDALKKHKEQNQDKEISKSAIDIVRLVDAGEVSKAMDLLNKGMSVYDNFSRIVAQQMGLPPERANEVAFTIMSRLTDKYMQRNVNQLQQYQQREQNFVMEQDAKRQQAIQEAQNIMQGESSGIRR